MAFALIPPARRAAPRAALCVALLPCLAPPTAAAKQDDPEPPAVAPASPAPESAEVAKERQTAERFLTLLERNPRPGTALDRAYAFFAERGELAALADRLRARAEADPTDAAAPAILGLIESRRGNDAEAVAAFEQAAERAPDDPNPRARLAEAYVLAGTPERAAGAYEAALARDPSRRDLPELLSGLGRVLTRSGQDERADAVWDRLIEKFPGDDAVREQIAAVLEAEGDLDGALARYEALAKETTDEYRRVTYGLKAGSLKVRTGQTEEAVETFEALLANLNPDSWLYREVRGGIERAFLRTDDLAGLTAYYEGWVEANPEDVAAMARLGELLDRQRRTAEARAWFEKAVKAAPGDGRLRRALVDQLLRADDYAAAAEQFAQLDELSPGDPDTLRDWGTVYLNDPSLSPEQRLAEAEQVWRKLLTDRAEDPVAVTQVADWLRQAGAEEPARALYARAVELAPDDPRYREYLGEYLHVLGKSEEAVQVWNGLAAGGNRSVRTLARLSEVLGGFGYDARAAEAAAAADALDRQEAGSADPAAGELEFADRMRFAELFVRAENADAAQGQITKAEALAVTPEERRAVLGAAIDADAAAGRLADRIAELKANAEENPRDAAVRLRLALYQDAAGEAAPAAATAAAAVALAPTDVTALATLSELQEKAGLTGDAVRSARRLADLDRQRRADHLTRVAELQLRLGQRDAALRTAREVVAGAPGNPEGLAFLSRVAFRLGNEDVGLDALRRAARGAGSDPGPLLELSAALADRFRTDEAVELLWRAFATVGSLDDKGLVVRRLAELSQRQNRFPEFLEKLERTAAGRRGGRSQDGPDRETALLLAEAHLAVNDAASARETLEPLLNRDPRDTALLARLATLAESAGDLEDAIGFQKRVVDLSESPAERMRLAGLLTASGDHEAAERFYLELLAGKTDPVERVRAIDDLLRTGREGLAVELADAGLARDPRDWELLTRLAFALVRAGNGELEAMPTSVRAAVPSSPDEPDTGAAAPERDPRFSAVRRDAAERKAIADAAFRRIWELDLDPDAPSAAAKAAGERRRSRRAGSGGRTVGGSSPTPPAFTTRSQAVNPVLSLLGLSDQRYYPYSSGAVQATFAPKDYGTARLLASAWLGDRDETFGPRVLADAGLRLPPPEPDRDEPEETGAAEDANPELFTPDANPDAGALWDAYLLLANAQRSTDVLPAEWQSRTVDWVAAVAERLARRPDAGADAATVYLYSMRSRQYRQPDAPEPDPLSAEEFALLERVIATVVAENPASAGPYRALLVSELERAGEADRAKALTARIVAEAWEPEEIQAALTALGSPSGLNADSDRFDEVLTLLNRIGTLDARDRARALPRGAYLVQSLATLVADGDLDRAFALLDAHADATAGGTTGPGTGSGASATTARPLVIWTVPQPGRLTQTGRNAGFPPPAAPIADEQVTLLYSLHNWLQTPDLIAGLREQGEGDGDEGNGENEAAAPQPDPAALIAHLRERAARPDAANRWHDLLRLACAQAWGGEIPQAVASLEAALAANPENGALRRVTAAARIERGDPAGGLALLDGFEPTDPDELRDRELLALRLAAQSGDLDRARAAADRLFGLRLGNAEQLELARSLQRLGMGEKADAVLARMRRGASNDAGTLAAMMDLYRGDGKEEVAAEIARSILARFRAPSNSSGRTTPAQAEAEAARRTAVRVLAQLDQLDPIVAGLQAKLERNPNARTVRTQLIALLTAAGRSSEARKLTAEIPPTAAAIPNNPQAMMARAVTLYGSNDYKAASELYEKVIAADPEAIGNNYWQVQRAFDRAKRGDALMAALAVTDPADWGRYRNSLTNLLNSGLNDADTREAAGDALRLIWKWRPESRDDLFNTVRNNTQALATDEVYEYAVDKLLEDPGDAGWDEFATITAYGDDPWSLFGQVIEAAEMRAKIKTDAREALDELAEKVDAARKKRPGWHAGGGLAAAIDAARGKPEEVRREIGALLELPEDEGPTGTAAWLLSVAIDPSENPFEPPSDELTELSLTLMRRAIDRDARTSYSGGGFEMTPQRRLADLLEKTGAKAEARELLLDAVFDRSGPDPFEAYRRGNAEYAARREVQSWTGIGQRLAKMGYTMDALRVLDHTLADRVPVSGMSSGNSEMRNLKKALEETRGALTPAVVAAELRRRLEADRAALAAGEELTPGPVLDLSLAATAGGDDLGDAAVTSGLMRAFLETKGKKDADDEIVVEISSGSYLPSPSLVYPLARSGQAAEAPTPDAKNAEEAAEPEPAPSTLAGRLAPLRAALAEYAEVRPDDVSLHAAAALLAFAADDDPAAEKPLAALLRIAESPREEPPAAETVGAWWLAGEAAAEQESTAEPGAALLTAAGEAAEELRDPEWRLTLGVLAGRAALDAGDAETAEARWTRLLGEILDRDLSGTEAGDAPPGDAGAFLSPRSAPPATGDVRALLLIAAIGAPAEPNPKPNAEPDSARAIPVTTGPRARRALELAQLAADGGLTDLSLRAVREALGGGAPLGGDPGNVSQVLVQSGQVIMRGGSVLYSGGGAVTRVRTSAGGGGGMFGVPAGPGGALANAVAGDGKSLSDDDVAAALKTLSARWEAAEADPAAVAATLLEVVLPTARPGEAFPYVSFADLSADGESPRDVVGLLLDWSGRAKARDAIRERMATRSPAGPAGAAIDLLEVRLAVNERRPEGVAERLTKIAADVSHGGTRGDGVLAMQAALPAIEAGIAVEEASDAFLAGAAAAGGDQEAVARYLPRLARAAYEHGDADAAVRLLDRSLAATRTATGGTRRVHRNALVTVVRELSRGGSVAAALDRLNELDRLPTFEGTSNVRRLNPHEFVPDLTRGAAGTSANDAFDALLPWTVPAADTDAGRLGAIRGWTAILPPDGPPAEFGRPADPARSFSSGADRPPAPLTGTLVALADAAVRANRTDELAAALDRADTARAAAVAAEEGEPSPILARINVRPRADGSFTAPAVGPVVPLGRVRSATLRLLAGLPADVPAALAAAGEVRDWADGLADANRSEVMNDFFQQTLAANLLLMWAALGEPDHRAAAAAELKALEGWASKRSKIGADYREPILALRAEAATLLVAPDAAPLTNDLGLWRSAALGSYAQGPAGRPAWAVMHGTAHTTGAAGANVLTFRVPLTGSFRLRVAAHNGNRAESFPVYGGLIHEAFPWNKTYRARDFHGTRYAERQAPFLASSPDQRYLIDVTPTETAVRVGGRLLTTDPTPPAGSPFLGLATTDGRRGLFRAVQVIGDPTIPAEVNLLAGDRADGWYAPTGNGHAPREGLEYNRGASRSQSRWEFVDGVLESTATAGRIMHHRPLFDGDRIAFEFHTVGTEATVAPSLDRVGFVLDPEGVRLRFLPVNAPRGRFDEDGGLSPARTVPAPGALGAVPLIPNAWNRAVLEAHAGRLTLSVNDVPVLERDLSAGAGTPHGAAHPDRLFGFAPSPGREAEVRNVVLSGDWPTELPESWKTNLLLIPELTGERLDPFAAQKLDAASMAHGRRVVALMGHGEVSRATWELLVAADALPAEERLRLLAAQVLPVPNDPFWRGDWTFSPADPPPGTTLPGVENPTDGRRVPTGGKLLSPILSLIDTAAELGRLDDLKAFAERIPATSVDAAAHKAALSAILAARTGGDVAPHVEHLEKYLGGLTKESENWRSRPVLIAARGLADAAVADSGNGAAKEAAARLANGFVKTFQNNFGGVWTVPKRQARAVLADLETGDSGTGDSGTGEPVGPAWVVAPDVSLLKGVRGLPAARWTRADDGDAAAIDHWAGGERDRLFAVRPAAPGSGGPLTVTAEPTVGWFKVVRVLNGGLGAQLEATRDHVSVRSFTEQRARPKLAEKVGGDRYRLAQSVAPDRFAAEIDGEPVWETPLGTDQFDAPLPFVALQARGDHGGSVRGLTMSGDATVPESVNLLPHGSPRIPDWWIDAYGDENNDRTTAGWVRDQHGLYSGGDSIGAVGGMDGETLLVFPRPLAALRETVRFEFLHQADGNADGTQADMAGVHVALGRIAFVLTDAGVRIHRITAGALDPAPLAADNLTEEPQNRRGPDTLDLSSGVWRTLELTVTGADGGTGGADTATLSLDGETIYERPIAPANRRAFGLFRWAGQRATRVRHVTLTGDWQETPAAIPGEK